MNLNTNFKALKKCRGELERLIFEMFIIRNKRPTINIQADSIPGETLIVSLLHFHASILTDYSLILGSSSV